jgi:hypothetical protein
MRRVLCVEDPWDYQFGPELSYLYREDGGPAFDYKEVQGVEAAISELKAHGEEYRLVLTNEFVFDDLDAAKPGPIHNLHGIVCRLLDYCRDYLPHVSVIMASRNLTRVPEWAEDYMERYPFIVAVLGKGFPDHRFKKLIGDCMTTEPR